MTATALAFAAAAAVAVAAIDLVGAAELGLTGLGARMRGVADVFSRVGREGVDPAAAERRRLLLAGSVASFAAGWLVFGVVGGTVAALLAPAFASRILRARRLRYRRAVDAAAGDIAVALADALSGGHSLRGALAGAAAGLNGPAAHELRRVAAELELGAATDGALEDMRRRIGQPGIEVIVAGALMQRRAGGDLAALLRSTARTFEDEARLLGEVRAATAQARFTGVVVVLLPLAGAGLAELGSPGFVAGLLRSPVTATLVGIATALQVGAAFAIRRLARIRA